jgi:RNA polymerase sigma-70 factor (ECF subfamily)
VQQRQAIVMYHLLELGIDEIAQQLGVAPGTVKSRLSRARSALAGLLREETFHA